jgi:hypothetical protein
MPKYAALLVPLPKYYNETSKGKRKMIEKKKFIKTADEIAKHLDTGGGIWWRKSGEGFWFDRFYDNRRYDDPLVVLDIDFVYTKATVAWLRKYAREILLERFRQIAIYMRIIINIEPILVEIGR